MGTTALGIVINFSAQAAVQGAQALGGALQGAQQRARGLGQQLAATVLVGKDLNQRLANIRQGLNDLAAGFKMAGDAALGMVKTALDSFSELDTGFARIDIALGFLGKNTGDVGRQIERAKIQEKVKQIGRDTEFTMKQAADAFTTLKQSGLSANDALAIIDKTMAFTSASAGTISLDDAASVAFNAMNKLKLSTEETNRALDVFTKATSESKLSFSDYNQIFNSSSASLLHFKGTSIEAFAAIAGAMRDFGKSPAEIGHGLQALQRASSSILTEFSRIEANGGKKSRRIKSIALNALGLTKQDLMTASGSFKKMDEIALLFLERRNQLMKSGMKQAEADTILKNALGTTQALDVVLALEDTMKKRNKSFDEIMGVIADSQDFSLLAQQRSLQTVAGQTELFKSAIDGLMATLGELVAKGIDPLRKKLTSIINEFSNYLAKNPAVAQALVKFVGVFGLAATAAGILLSAFALVFSATLALAPIFIKAAAVIAKFGGIIGVAKAAILGIGAALLPVLLVVGKFAAVSAIMHFAWKENLGGIRTTVTRFVSDVKAAFKVLGPMLSGEGVNARVWDSLSTRTQNIVILIVLLRNRLRNLVDGFKAGFVPVFKAAVYVFGTFAGLVTWAIDKLASLGIITGKVALSTRTSATTFELLGKVIGALTGMFVIYAAAIRAIVVMKTAWAVATKVVMVVLRSLRMMLVAARVAAMLFNISISVNPIVLMAIGIMLLIAAVVLLIYYFKEINAWIKDVTGGWFSLYDALLLLLGPIGWIALAFKKVYEGIESGAINVFEVILPLFLGPIGIMIVAIRRLIMHWDSVVSGMKAIWEPIGPYITAAWETTISAVKAAFWGLVSFAAAVMFGILKAIGEVLAIIGTTFEVAFDLIVALITLDFQRVGQIITEVVLNVAAWFVNTWNAVAAKFSEIMNSVGNFFVGLWDTVAAAFTRVWEFVSKIFGTFWSNLVVWFGQQWSEFWTPILNFGEVLYQAGVNWVTQLWEGIKAEFAPMIEWVESKVDYIGSLWPFSPAKHGPLRERPPEQGGANYVKFLQQGMDSQFPAMIQSVIAHIQEMMGIVQPAQNAIPQAAGATALAATPAATLPPLAAPSLFGPAANTDGAPSAKQIQITVNLTMGEVRITADSLTDAEVKRFAERVTTHIADGIQTELMARSMA